MGYIGVAVGDHFVSLASFAGISHSQPRTSRPRAAYRDGASQCFAETTLGALGVARAQPNPQKDVERVIRDLLVAFSNRDFAVFVPYFAEDATVFFPPSTAAPLGRVQGRSDIERTFKTIFDAYPPRTTRPPTPIARRTC